MARALLEHVEDLRRVRWTMVDTRWIAWRGAWWGGRHVGWQQWGIEGGGGGRAVQDGAVAHDWEEGK